MIRFLVLSVALLFCLATQAQENSIKTLVMEDYYDLVSVSSPQISPDGETILYSRSWINKYTDGRDSDIWIMNADGTRDRFFMDGGRPIWSPCGKMIAFVKQGDPKGSQIFIRYMDMDTPPTQITRVDYSPGSIQWSPDGKWISFTMTLPDSDSWPVKMPKKPKGAEWIAPPRIVDDLVYRRDRQGFIEEGYTHIFVVRVDGGVARQVTSGDWDHGGGYCWTPDGKEILFSSLRIEEAEYAYRESEIYSVDVASGKITQLTDRKGPDSNPHVSPDGKWIAYQGYDYTDDTFINAKLYLMRRDGSRSRLMGGAFDKGFSILEWAKDNSGIYLNVSEEGTGNLYFVPVNGNLRQITQGEHRLSVSSISDGGIAVGTVSGPHHPGDLFMMDTQDPKITLLTAVNRDLLEPVTLGDVNEIWYKSTDDFDIQGWYITPPGFDPDKKYPMILVIHGGPHGMYSVSFNFSWQIHAAEGYVVLYTNPRGSSGYGSAFGNAIKNDYPNKDYDDLMNGVDEMIRKGFVDEDNLFVYGGSGGGVLTAWIVGHTDRFAAASVNYPVINWLSFVGNTDGASWYRNFEKMPWEDPTEHLRRSPLMYVGNVTTPTMLMTGIKDLRTPISQTEEFYQALKVRKVPTAMIRFNEEYHGTSSHPSNYLRTLTYLHYWFEKYRNGGAVER